MSSYRQHLYHLVFRTKNSFPSIKQDNANELYSYMTVMGKPNVQRDNSLSREITLGSPTNRLIS